MTGGATKSDRQHQKLAADVLGVCFEVFLYTYLVVHEVECVLMMMCSSLFPLCFVEALLYSKLHVHVTYV